MASRNIGNLAVLITGNSSGLVNALTDAQKRVDQFQRHANVAARGVTPKVGIADSFFKFGPLSASSLTPNIDKLAAQAAKAREALSARLAAGARAGAFRRDQLGAMFGGGPGQFVKMSAELGLAAAGGFVRGFGAVVGGVARVVPMIGQVIGGVVDGIGAVFGHVIGLAGTLGTAIKHMVSSAMDFQDLLVGFKVMTGSAAAGREMLTQLEKFAATLPFESAHVMRAARTLAGNGVAMTNVLPALNAIASVVAGTGGGNEKFDNMVLAFSQVMSMGRLMGQELRQLNDAGFTIDLIAKSLRVTAGEVRGLMEAGKISSGDIANAFNMAIAEGGRFYKLLEEQAATPRGQIRRLGSELAITSRGIGEGFIALMQESGVLDFMMGAVKSVQTHLPTIKAKLAEFGGYLKGWVLSAAGAVASAFENLAPIADGINRFLVRPLIIGVGLIYGAVTWVLKQIGKLFSFLSSVWKMPDITGAFGAVLPAEFKAVLDATDVSFAGMAGRVREFSDGLGGSLDRLGAVGRAAFAARTEIGAIAVPRSLPGDLKEVIDNIRKVGREGATAFEKFAIEAKKIRDIVDFFPMPAFAREHAANLNDLVAARYGPGAMTISPEEEQMALGRLFLDLERSLDRVSNELPRAMERNSVEAASTISKAMASQQGAQSVQERVLDVLRRTKEVADQQKEQLMRIGAALGAPGVLSITP